MPGGEIMRHGTTALQPTRASRETLRQSQAIYDEIRLKGLMAEGTSALAAHIMNGLVELDGHRNRLAGDNPALQLVLAEIMAEAINQSAEIQRQTFKCKWGL